MAPQQDDYYSLLGVDRSASHSEIGRAYRRAARATHPDAHPDETSAAERFNAVSTAYQTLGNPDRRTSYDRSHPAIRPTPNVRVVVHRYHQPDTTAPVHLGRRRPRPEPLRPFTANPTTPPVADVLFELASTLSRLIGGWPF